MNEDCELRFCMSLENLKKIPKKDLTNDQEKFIILYEKYIPVIETDCVMNKICKYIESKDFHIKKKVRTSEEFDWRILVTEGFVLNKPIYSQVSEKVFDVFNQWKLEDKNKKKKQVAKIGVDTDENFQNKEGRYIILKQELEKICSNEEQLTNHLVYLFYVDKPSYNKTILWYIVGKQIYETMKNKTKSFYIPVRNDNGNLEFLYEKYSIERVEFDNEG